MRYYKIEVKTDVRQCIVFKFKSINLYRSYYYLFKTVIYINCYFIGNIYFNFPLVLKYAIAMVNGLQKYIWTTSHHWIWICCYCHVPFFWMHFMVQIQKMACDIMHHDARTKLGALYPGLTICCFYFYFYYMTTFVVSCSRLHWLLPSI